uniref:CUB domain containing protein 2 n=1 Tax=Cyprinus carpio TaxID=7962 RepID=A0A8C1P2M5_CYPCA
IVVSEGSSVLLTFHHFELEYHTDCAYDYIKIYNGISEDEGNLLGKFCGDVSPPQFSSSWYIMSIFSIQTVILHTWVSPLATEKVRNMYGGVLTGLSGVISSPGYALEYNNNASCSWTVHVPNQSVVSLVFLDFQLENNEGPPNTITTSNHLLVVFKSDFNIGVRGFKCQQILKNISGNFTSPHYPNIYPNNIKCHWTITLAAGYRIKLFFPFWSLRIRTA